MAPFSPHVMTQVDKLHAKGITGKGVKVAILDTGVDYTNPALGGCFGKGCPISFGYDLVGDRYDPSSLDPTRRPAPDKDPIDCHGHGTHVAGIIAARDNPWGFNGAAPGADLGMYRVFGCGPGVSDEVLISAVNMAFEDGADIITGSLGSHGGWTESALETILSRVVDRGVVCTFAAGNSGAFGFFSPGGPADGNGVTSVSSFEAVNASVMLYTSHYSTHGGEWREFGFVPATRANWNVTLPIYATSLNTSITNDACKPLPDSTPNLGNKIVLIRMGTCLPYLQARYAGQKGANHIMFYNDVPGASTVSVADRPLPHVRIVSAGMVEPETGEAWVKALKAGSVITVNVANIN
ncbi:hypothetical protein PLICBS_002133 [Purpureocillium lilacinum]|nr:hypothetical protein PLICBS_002133 [Purpureocillium lilacinum]